MNNPSIRQAYKTEGRDLADFEELQAMVADGTISDSDLEEWP